MNCNRRASEARRSALTGDDDLRAGVRCWWWIEPESRWLTEYRVGRPLRDFAEADTIGVDDVIPGLQFALGSPFSA